MTRVEKLPIGLDRHLLRRSRPDLVAPVRIDPEGLHGPTRAATRSGRWRRSHRGWFVPAGVTAERPDQRIIEAAVLIPSGGAVTGWAALRWLGGYWFTGAGRPVPIVTGDRHLCRQRGVWVSEEGLDPRDRVRVDGLMVTTPARSVCFEMRYARTIELAVAAMDMAAYSDLCSVMEAAAYASHLQAWTGIPQCREALGMADENAWSPPEVTMRLWWRSLHGVVGPLTNRPVFTRDGAHLGTPDLIDPRAGVVGEYDGGFHLATRQRAADLARDERYRSVGLEPVMMVAADLRQPDRFLSRLIGAYARARRDRSAPWWTLDRPPTWTATHTVLKRRALSAAEAGYALRYRRSA